MIESYQDYKIVATHFRTDKNEIRYILANPIGYNVKKMTTFPNALEADKIQKVKYMLKDSKTFDAKTGVGISNEYAENIFEPFVCLDESKNREKSGFGGRFERYVQGLSIARNLAVVNGYSLILDTDYTRGCRFILKT